MANWPVPSVNPLTGELPELVLQDLRGKFASHTYINVYDKKYGAVDASASGFGAVKSQAALDLAMADAEAKASAGDRVMIQIPYGAVAGDLNIRQSYISIIGPGTLLDGYITYMSLIVNELKRFYSVVTNLGMRPSNPAAARTGGVAIIGGAFVEVFSNKFQDMEIAVHSDTWSGLAGQQNKTIHVHDNQIVNVDYAMKCTNRNGATWDAHADMKFFNNIGRHAYITHVHIDGADGFDAYNNTAFCVGYQSTDTYHRQMKRDGIYVGPDSNFITIHHNKLFEAGTSGIHLDRVKNALVQGNEIIWAGQVVQSPGIRITTDAAKATNGILIDGNIIDEGTQHGIGIYGTGNAGNITIPDTNVIRLFRDTTRNVYVGTAPLVTNDIARIFVESSVTVLPRITASQMPRNSRKGVVAIGGMYSVARRQTHTDSYETVTHHRRTVTRGTAVILGLLRSTGDLPVASPFVGRVVVQARHLGSGLVARYEFTAASNGINKPVQNLQASGSVVDLSDGTSPAFTFSIVQATTSLNATPTTNTAGEIEFTVIATGGVQTSYNPEEFNALPLANPM